MSNAIMSHFLKDIVVDFRQLSRPFSLVEGERHDAECCIRKKTATSMITHATICLHVDSVS